MTGGGDRGRPAAAPPRRLTLTPISFDIAIALGQLPEGLRLSPLAHAIGSPVSSVQAALRILVSTGLAVRTRTTPPMYRLAEDHPAVEPLVTLSIVVAEPAHALAILLRANPAVRFAAVDSRGFVVALSGEPGDDRVRLDRAMEAVRGARIEVPRVELFEEQELGRHLAVSVGLRDRVRSAIVLKGHPPARPGPAPPTTRRTEAERQLVR
ncbi:MAG TPA: hypothetical protein VLA44_01435 [Clostridia bacterium]|nr:hypothetical protein [Clostridia bacterium]